MRTVRPIVLDFETKPINDRHYLPHYPPEPVGVSIRLPGERKASYSAWGHRTGGNNCSFGDGMRRVAAAYRQARDSGCGVVFHNAKFDLRVAQVHMGLDPLPWELVHDTYLLLFLDDPHSPSLGLKEAAERLLGMPPEERDAVLEWAKANRLVQANAKEAGKFIWEAPGTLVGPYADGDCLRTLKLFDLLLPRILERGMGGAYDRERRLMPILMRNEEEGVHIDTGMLRADVRRFSEAGEATDKWIRRKLGSRWLNVDSGEELAEALVQAGAADENLFAVTATGKRSVAKDSLNGAVTDPKVMDALDYRGRLKTFVGTFMMPWLEEAEECGGLVHPSWNQVRSEGAGARTGRMSATRFMNVPKKADPAPPKFCKGLPALPSVRGYFMPDKGGRWLKRDYAQQEIRVLAHFEDGPLLKAFAENPRLDIHAHSAALISACFDLPWVERRHTKSIGFGLLYGMGLEKLAYKMGLNLTQASAVREAYLNLFPGLKKLQRELKALAASREPFRTFGGRLYYCEPAKVVDGVLRSFDYKMLNYLIQGSSADCTKEALIRYDAEHKDARFLLMVHDEIDVSAPVKAVAREMRLLRDVMASIEFDVPMLSDGGMGLRWGYLEEYAS